MQTDTELFENLRKLQIAWES